MDGMFNFKKVLVVTSVEAEKEAFLRGLGESKEIEVAVVGVGVVAAAVNTALLLATNPFDLVINAGIAGGFNGKAEVSSIVVSNELVAADLGAETAEGFLSLADLNLGSISISVDQTLSDGITKVLLERGLDAQVGPILTLSTVTGTAEKAENLQARFPSALAEAMEGYGVGFAASQKKVPVLELRSISNMVGPRNRNEWKIKEALIELEKAASILKEVL
ncbi:futalosine hydrolase [Halalkalibacter akibai]|uniref:Futalosine hydrolase n=1 Tax=Halalkalibacter akibai (strain ATCC 43226 / DSM 21942 / CIP 109018 / JCM 9157 / 1139) TaxID=1236973 RepID=W4QZ80_HALA3|nr:futalosine hydrolase [Halalkalibacter akibai]GAE36619.1 menaquinone via futalosine step 2 [Halalkalibacter akibai JCM 9157]